MTVVASIASNKVFSQDAGREWLLTQVVEVQAKFLECAQLFYSHGERNESDCLRLADAIIHAIESLLQAYDWDSSLFLKSTIKPFRALKEDVLGTRQALLQEQGEAEIPMYALLPDEEKVYVSLYQADGHNIAQWEAQLASLDAYMVGRPVYKNEADIQKTIHQKLLQIAEAYAVVVVHKSDIISQDVLAKTDRHGHPLVSIEMGKVNGSHVREFVHAGRRYHYHRQHLVLADQ